LSFETACIDHNHNIQKLKYFVEDGIYVDVDLKTLIEEIYVSPKAKRWFVDLVKSILEKYSMGEKKVIQSNLYNGSLY
jgi:hypothetical protein